MRKPLEKANTRGLHLAILVLISCAWVVGLLGILNLNGALQGFLKDATDFLTSCPLRGITGDKCPLCGTITATSLIFSGDLGAALETNPLALALLPLALSQPVYRLIRVIRPNLRLREELLVTGGGLGFLVVVLAMN